MIQTLKNELLTVEIDTFGAEVKSIKNNQTGQQYLWYGDKTYWGRRSPVLFPLVGSVWNGEYRMDGKEYRLGQHGFARDNEFEILHDVPEDEAWFVLQYNESTLALYPRRFRLEIGYKLEGERLTVMWRVKNLDDKRMDFHIGAHPAFLYPDFSPEDKLHGYFLYDCKGHLHSQLIQEKGCIGEKEFNVELDEEGMLPLTSETFGINTIILAEGQVRRVSLLDKHRNPYLTVFFNAPVVGMWSPSPDAPFLCIEPWWGRCDRVGYTGEFSDREYTNHLEPGKSFESSYMIVFENI